MAFEPLLQILRRGAADPDNGFPLVSLLTTHMKSVCFSFSDKIMSRNGVFVFTVLTVIFSSATTDPVKWSPSQEESDFEPSVLELWSDLQPQPAFDLPEDVLTTTWPVREDNVEKNTATDRIVSKPPSTLQDLPEDVSSTAFPERVDKVMKKPTPDRIVNKQPNKPQDASETDLFLLGAIEKLAYRMDFLEKRVIRMENMLYQILAGSPPDSEPCPEGFTRQNSACYHFSSKLVNWKSASSMCRSMGGILLELPTEHDRQKFIATVQANPETKGNDYWTGGLNPGLLWLWGTSAKPIASNSTHSDIVGNGRCLLLGYQPPIRSYQLKGTDCAVRNRYVCQIEDNVTERGLVRLIKNSPLKI